MMIQFKYHVIGKWYYTSRKTSRTGGGVVRETYVVYEKVTSEWYKNDDFEKIIRTDNTEKLLGVNDLECTSQALYGKKLKPTDTSKEAFYLQNSNLQPG